MGTPVKTLGWKQHWVRVGDDKDRWTVRPAEYQILHHPDGRWTPPFGLAKMDNGEIILMASHRCEDEIERTVFAFSADEGDTWSDFQMIPDSGRPLLLAYLGQGRLTYQLCGRRLFSDDYGRTWHNTTDKPAPNGKTFYCEGNPLVDYDELGRAVRMAEIGYSQSTKGTWTNGTEVFIRWSRDGGRTWADEHLVKSAEWEDQREGKSFIRWGCEGSLTRAANGWLVAALRILPLPEYLDGEEGVDFDDSLCGTAVVISQDDGKTWTQANILFDAGRHHAHLLTLPDGRIVMTMTVRVDVRNGELASYRRGCDALISTDNGLTWNLDRRVVLDEYAFFDGRKWFNGECGHLYSVLLDNEQILTAHSNYLNKGVTLIRWTP